MVKDNIKWLTMTINLVNNKSSDQQTWTHWEQVQSPQRAKMLWNLVSKFKPISQVPLWDIHTSMHSQPIMWLRTAIFVLSIWHLTICSRQYLKSLYQNCVLSHFIHHFSHIVTLMKTMMPVVKVNVMHFVF